MAPEPLGPRVFSRAIRSTPLPSPFQPLTSIAKYNSETKPELWLADFQLACQLGGARGDDRAIIRQLRLLLSDTARRWLDEVPANQIHGWTDLVWVFEGDFKWTSAIHGTPAIHGTSASASRNVENPSKSTLDASPSNAPSSHTSPTMQAEMWRIPPRVRSTLLQATHRAPTHPQP